MSEEVTLKVNLKSIVQRSLRRYLGLEKVAFLLGFRLGVKMV